MITKQQIAGKILSYMRHEIELSQLVNWAEDSIQNGGFEPGSEEIIRNVLGTLGLADVNDFGLLWEDCERLMSQLGYKVKVEAALVN
ncbi:MAG: hypothetical protein AB7K37_14555 [Cyclobacteriaceae bacterium]